MSRFVIVSSELDLSLWVQNSIPFGFHVEGHIRLTSLQSICLHVLSMNPFASSSCMWLFQLSTYTKLTSHTQDLVSWIGYLKSMVALWIPLSTSRTIWKSKLDIHLICWIKLSSCCHKLCITCTRVNSSPLFTCGDRGAKR